jgi:short-subunit dehydrogenase
MKIAGMRILITGAGGGIGQQLALALAKKGGILLLADRELDLLEKLRGEIASSGGKASVVAADLLREGAPEQLADAALRELGEVDVLINLAGIMSFNLFQNETSQGIERLWRVNVIAPMQLTRALLPHMLARGTGRIVNIGSVFGSIGFPFFANYSANKFAVRGFSQALRRELESSGVGVTYVAPRYTRTPINAGPVSRMSEALGMNMDDPDVVAANIVRAIEKEAKEYYIGFPESLFVRINGILPGLVDGSLRKQAAQMRGYAEKQ